MDSYLDGKFLTSEKAMRVACAILATVLVIGEAILRGLRKACDHFESSGRPIRAACAPLAAVWAIGKANLRGRRSACGHLGHRQSHSAWLACAVFAAIWAGGRRLTEVFVFREVCRFE